MQKLTMLISLVLLYSFSNAPNNLKTIKSIQIDSNHFAYNNSIDEYKKSEEWAIWSIPITGIYRSTSNLNTESSLKYAKNCITDYDLNTYWEGKLLSKIVVVFHNPELFGAGLEFYGKINLFNGCCESESKWKEYSRVKTMKIYFNTTPICLVELRDTWHFQSFDISNYFQNKYKENKSAQFEIKRGDAITFEIVEQYYGSKYKELIISEFMAQGAAN